MLLYKKRDITKLPNYTPINIYILTKRLNPKLEFYPHNEQADFRTGYQNSEKKGHE